MEQQNNTEQQNNLEPQKLFFGLSPKATFINSIVIAVLGQLLWSIVAVSQISLESLEQPAPDVPWYYNLPLSILSIIMLLRWIDFKYKIGKLEFSARSFKFHMLGIIGMSIVQMFVKIFFLIILLALKF